jgi:two-component system, cell cycle sensor histidine kinase and response regulator CckA
MAPMAAIHLILASGAVLALDKRRGSTSLWPSEALAALIGLTALFTLLAYVYGAVSLRAPALGAWASAPSACAFVFVALGLTWSRTAHGVPRLFASRGPGGVLARRLVPVVSLLPAVLGWAQVNAKWIEPHLGSALLAAGNTTGLLVLSFAIAVALERSDRAGRSAEQRLRDGEARKTAMLEAALDCVVSMDEQGRITEFNAAAERTFGYARTDVIGRPLAEVMIPVRLREQHQKGLRRYLSTGHAEVLGRRTELVAMRNGGQELPVELAIVRIGSSAPIEFTAYIRDLSERRVAEETRAELTTQAQTETAARRRAEVALQRSEDHLRQSQKLEAIGRLAGGIAHDFNNMLSVILGSANLLSQELTKDESLRGEVREIESAAGRAAALTRQLLAFSRQQVLEPRVVDLNDLILKLDGMLRRMIGEDIELQLTTDPNVGRVLVDPGQIENVIVNLVINARDAMPRGGALRLVLEAAELDREYVGEHLNARVGPHVMIAVSDSGVGMEPEVVSRIFEPFFTTKEQDKGTGLGLAMVFGTVTQSGGHIAVESEPGRGTTFRLYFPRTERAPSLPGPAPEELSSRGSEQVLLVEDEEQVRRVISLTLKRFGYSVTEATSADHALRLAQDPSNDIDLLLTDVVMPGMSGPDLAARVRSIRTGLKVLCMSGYNDEAMLRYGLDDPGMAYLQKPVTPDNLARKVRDVLDH